MAHFAKLDENNIVLETYAVANAALDSKDEEASGIIFLTEWSGGYANWKQTSYNGNFRKQYAGIGYFYNSAADVFIAPQPYPSWSLNENYDWQAPVPYPSDEKQYFWDEALLEWALLIPPSE
jgi:hypothetical protein